MGIISSCLIALCSMISCSGEILPQVYVVFFFLSLVKVILVMVFMRLKRAFIVNG